MNISFFVSSLSFGGAEKQAIADANLLSKAGSPTLGHVVLLSFRRGDLTALIQDKVKYIQVKKQNYAASAWHLAGLIKKENIDIIHASLFAPMVISALASLIVPVKVVWHFHSHEYDIPLRSRLAFRWLARLPRVRKILFVNHELMEHFSIFDFPEAKQGVLYNHSEIQADVDRPEKDGQVIDIGYLGRLVSLKRVEYLVDLTAYLKNQKGVGAFCIHIVGDGDNLLQIREQVTGAGLDDFFVFHGFQEDVAEYYKKFDIFVNPSSEECLCMSMIDAGMSALPVVAFDVGGNNEIVIHGQTGYIVQNKDEFLGRCLDLIQDSIKQKAFGEKARVHCLENFSREKRLDNLQKLHGEIV